MSRLSREDQIYITSHESQWETALDASESKSLDALENCTDYNRRLGALLSGGTLEE